MEKLYCLKENRHCRKCPNFKTFPPKLSLWLTVKNCDTIFVKSLVLKMHNAKIFAVMRSAKTKEINL